MQSWRTNEGLSKGQAAGYVSVEATAVRISWVTRGALAAGRHGVADAHRTPLDVLHLVGPVAITHRLLRPVIVADVDGILSPPPRNTDGEMVNARRPLGGRKSGTTWGGGGVTTW